MGKLGYTEVEAPISLLKNVPRHLTPRLRSKSAQSIQSGDDDDNHKDKEEASTVFVVSLYICLQSLRFFLRASDVHVLRGNLFRLPFSRTTVSFTLDCVVGCAYRSRIRYPQAYWLTQKMEYPKRYTTIPMVDISHLHDPGFQVVTTRRHAQLHLLGDLPQAFDQLKLGTYHSHRTFLILL